MKSVHRKIDNILTINDAMSFIEGLVNDYGAGNIEQDEFYGYIHSLFTHIRAKQRENLRKKVLMALIETVQNETVRNRVLLKINSEI